MTGSSNIFKNTLSINPIIVKEIRSRMRGPRAFITLTLTLLLMGGTMYGVLQLIEVSSSMGSNILSPQIGQALFAVLAFMELFMVCAVTPAVTSGAISGEKEKQTYEMLMATPLSSTRILWGKLISALSYVFLLIFAGIPLASVVFIFGGVSLSDMLRVLVVLLGVAVAFGVLGLFMSALFGRTGRATVASFVAVIFLMIGPLFIAALVAAMRNSEPPRWILAPSPISALSAALASGMGANNSIGGIFYTLSGLFNIGVQTVSQTSIPRPLYHYSIPFYVALTTLLTLLSIRLVQPTRRWRLNRKEWAVSLGTLVVIAGLITGGYFITRSRYEMAFPGKGQNQIEATQVPQIMAQPVQKQVVVAQAVATATPEITATPLQAVTTMPDLTTTPDAAASDAAASGANIKLTDADQVEIYAAIANRLFTKDNTFDGGTPDWQILYLINTTDDSIGDPDTVKDPSVKVSSAVQQAVANQLIKNLNAKVIWIDTQKDAPIDAKTGAVAKDRGAIIHFGNLHPQKDGSLQVPASLYFSSLGGTGKTYLLKKVDGVWTITGTTGKEWIS